MSTEMKHLSLLASTFVHISLSWFPFSRFGLGRTRHTPMQAILGGQVEAQDQSLCEHWAMGQ
jgi:hypothetical protein